MKAEVSESCSVGRKPRTLAKGQGIALVVARALRKCISRYGRSSAEVRKKMGVSQTLYYRLYNGISDATAGKHFSKIASVFRISASEFLLIGAEPAPRKHK